MISKIHGTIPYAGADLYHGSGRPDDHLDQNVQELLLGEHFSSYTTSDAEIPRLRAYNQFFANSE